MDSVLVLLIGMLVIFLVLTIIIFVVKSYVGVFKLLDAMKKKGDKKEEPKPQVKEVQPVVEKPVQVATSNDELIAVITAAITAVYAQSTDDGEVPPFRVKSIFLK